MPLFTSSSCSSDDESRYASYLMRLVPQATKVGDTAERSFSAAGIVIFTDGDREFPVPDNPKALSACELTRQHHIKKSPAKVLLFFENKEIVTQKFEDG